MGAQTTLSVIRGTGPGAFAKGGPGAVPIRRGLLEPPASDPLGACHLARFPAPAFKVWVWLLLVRNHQTALAPAAVEDVSVGTGLSGRTVRRALVWLTENPEGAPYLERVQRGGGERVSLYRINRDECLRGLEEAPRDC